MAAVSGLDVNELYHHLIPTQIFGLFCMLVMGFVLGLREKRRLAANLPIPETLSEPDTLGGKNQHQIEAPRSRWVFYLNVALVVGATLLLLLTHLQAYVIFMCAFAAAMIINYPSLKQQEKVMKNMPIPPI